MDIKCPRRFRENNSMRSCSALIRAEFFHQTPAGYTAERKTKRKRNMGCYELLSASCHPLSLSSSPPPPYRASVAPPAATLLGLTEGRPPPPPPTHSPLLNWDSFQRPWPKVRTASIKGVKSVAAEFGQLL